MKKLAAPSLAIIGVLAVVLLIYWTASGDGRPEVHQPFVCADCGAVVDISELKKDYPKNWRMPPNAPSDSVVICIRCNKGWMYPVARCERCNTQYILHRVPRTRCPSCFPEVAEAAKKAGIDILYKGP